PEELREELHRLMMEHIEFQRKQTFGGVSEEEFRREEEALQRIREVSADYLALLKGKLRESKDEPKNRKES
ncbi:MAG: hypothetical protein WA859_00685, partial [Candidatus Sulfotelmatobacter sp.]